MKRKNLSLDVLEQIRLLTNLETTTDKLLQIILVGQPELQALLNRPALRQLNQRITARYHLHGLDARETAAYIRHRLQVCQGDPQLFSAAALRAVFRLSGGIPRLINRLCDRSLLGAYASERSTITASIVAKAAKEVGIVRSPARQTTWQQRAVGLGILGATLSVALLWAIVAPPAPLMPPVSPAPVAMPNHLAVLQAQAATSLSEALAKALPAFAKQPNTQKALDCEAMERLGLACFLDKSSWKAMVALHRPVILELELPPKKKVFVLLTGVTPEAAIFALDQAQPVPLNVLLQYWNGYYLLLWEPPVPGMKELAPEQTHAAVLWLRQLLGSRVANPAKAVVFDKALAAKVMAFQQQQELDADGVVGARTFIQLQNTYQAGRYPLLQVKE